MDDGEAKRIKNQCNHLIGAITREANKDVKWMTEVNNQHPIFNDQ